MLRSLVDWIRTRWQTATEEHRSIFSAALSVVAFSLLGKLATAAKEVAVAWRFGVSPVVDAYLFVFNLFNWGMLIWFSVLTVVLIPLEARLRRESPEQLRVFRAELLGLTIVVGLLLVAASRLMMPALLTSRIVGLPPPTQDLALEILPRLALLALVGPLVALYSTWMMSGGRNANTLLEGVPSLAILGAVLTTDGVESLVWGTLVGTVVQLVCLAWPRISAVDVRLPSLRLSSSAWRPFVDGFALVLGGQVIIGLTTLVDQFFAAGLGTGAISSFSYAMRLIGLVTNVVAITVTRATLPVFSRATIGDEHRIRRIAFQWGASLGLVGTVAALIGIMLAPGIVRILFERGTFTASDTERVATLLQFGLLALPFYISSLVFVSLHSSRRRYRVIVLCCVVGLVVKLGAMLVLVGPLGVPALMISSALMYLANLVLLVRRA